MMAITMKHSTASTQPLVLPQELATEVVQHLFVRDLCSATMACKAFYHWANALEDVYIWITGRRPLASFLRFHARRAQLGLKVLVIITIQCHQQLAGSGDQILSL